jgi:hypothetical protein
MTRKTDQLMPAGLNSTCLNGRPIDALVSSPVLDTVDEAGTMSAVHQE